MNTVVFLDTNVLVYAITVNDPKAAIAQAILSRPFILSVQVLNEYAHVLRRKLKWSWQDVAEALVAVRTLCPFATSITLDTHERAVALVAIHSFAFYDALIVASALDAGCTTLLSEDMQDGQVIEGRLTIRNPFRTGGP